MVSLKEFTIKLDVLKDGSSRFIIGPLPKGYGHTLGNFLRRILLTSIPGSAITSVKIDGVEHEYSTMAGVPDDVLTILLSLKNVIVISKTLEPVKLRINVKGKAGAVVEVKASDIEKSADIEIVNEDYVITKLNSGSANFSAEITVERGVGYSQPSDDKRNEISLIPLDASFSPVKLVNYVVTSARVGRETDLDQLELVLVTNGAVKAEEALFIAVDMINEMTEHLKDITNNLLTGDNTAVELNEKEKTKVVNVVKPAESDEKLPVNVSELNLSTRLTNSLLKSGYDDLRKLENMNEEELSNIKGMGNKSFVELLEVLKKYSVKLN